jgi:hypothetical protein
VGGGGGGGEWGGGEGDLNLEKEKWLHIKKMKTNHSSDLRNISRQNT